eukprot:8162942-Lingulodinium_polyedra.AAC.1
MHVSPNWLARLGLIKLLHEVSHPAHTQAQTGQPGDHRRRRRQLPNTNRHLARPANSRNQ